MNRHVPNYGYDRGDHNSVGSKCYTCGALVHDESIHDEWHADVESSVEDLAVLVERGKP